MTPAANVRLAEHTTLAVGGPAAWWCEARDVAELCAALAWADERSLPVVALGGGSNMLVADRGIEALVVRVRIARFEAREESGTATLSIGAGVAWDELVAWTVAHGYAGIECLSGIPGDVGAAPMQNIGAYGQEVAGVIARVRLVERASGRETDLDAEACRFGYRDSVFKHEAADRYLITGVDFRFHAGPPTIAYPELERALAAGAPPTLADVRRTVVALRRAKSMVLDASDENRHSAGSFFVNPVVAPAVADEAAARAARLAPGQTMPRFPQTDGHKLSAAWLIERAGFAKGTRRGAVGLSTRHTLAIVNFGGGTAADIIAFAAEIRARVRDAFGVTLTPEPRFYGFRPDELAALSE
jgi:UDP-N-acetylmuramate dehydrogenase